jgi:hypothetical protein
MIEICLPKAFLGCGCRPLARPKRRLSSSSLTGCASGRALTNRTQVVLARQRKSAMLPAGPVNTKLVYWADSTGGRNTFMWRWANGATTGMGSCPSGAAGDAFAGAACGGQARTPAAVLGGDRQGNAEWGRRH